MENLVNLRPLFVNSDKEYNFKSDQEPCILCQKPMYINDNTKYIHMTTDLYATSLDDHQDSQGMFPIGNDCCKKLPKSFIFKF